MLARLIQNQNEAEAVKLQVEFGRTLLAAREFEGTTAPNPPVGCVILDASGNVLAVAAHRKAGRLHAEALAIQKCRDAGTVNLIHSFIVTLEPCNHHGRTGPCTEAILTTPAQHIWIGAYDPNRHGHGGGAAVLRAAGLNVEIWHDTELEQQAKRLIAPFAKLKTSGLPWITVKQTFNVSGSMIPPAGQKTFTSHSSLVLAHSLRKRADAIITGSGTVLADAPLFTVRHVEDFENKKRILVLMDRRRRVSAEYKAASQANGFDVTVGDSIAQTLQQLGEAGVMEVLVEAGPLLTQEFLTSGVWDEHVLIKQATPHDHIKITHNKEFSHVLGNH